MRVAICDDQPDFVGELVEGIKKSNLFDGGWSIKTYYDGMQLLFDYETADNPFDLILIDIDMPQLNGIQTGQAIRECDQAALITYITNYREYALDAYQARPFNYLLKPLEPDALHQLLSSACRQLGRQSKQFLFIDGQKWQTAIPLHEIIYIECADHLSTIYTKGQSISCFKPLQQIAKDINAPYFTQVSRSVLVNLWEVATFDKYHKQVILKNGMLLPVSARKIKPFMKQYMEILRYGHTTNG